MPISLETTVSFPFVRGFLALPLTTVTVFYKGHCMVEKQVLAGKGLSDSAILSIMQERMAKQLAYAYEVGIKEGIALANATKRKESPATSKALDSVALLKSLIRDIEADVKRLVEEHISAN